MVLPRLQDFTPRRLSMLSYAVASVGHSSKGSCKLLRRVGEQMAMRINGFNAQELTLVLWSMGVSGVLDPAGPAVVAAAGVLPSMDLNTIDQQQLFQAHLACGGQLLQDHSLRNACWRIWQVEVANGAVISETTIDLSDTVSLLGLPMKLGARTADGLMNIDIQTEVGGARVAVELDGPGRLCINPPHRMLGRTRLKRRLLEERGWKVVNIPHVAWDGLRGDSEKAAYLKMQLTKQAGVPG